MATSKTHTLTIWLISGGWYKVEVTNVQGFIAKFKETGKYTYKIDVPVDKDHPDKGSLVYEVTILWHAVSVIDENLGVKEAKK